MITSSGKIVQIHGKKYCVKCERIKDHTCFHYAYRKSEKDPETIQRTEKWYCNSCETEKFIVREIPKPTEMSMLVKLLMSLRDRYELAGSTIEVGLREVKATFRFPENDLSRLREIAEHWAERGVINGKHLLMLEKAGMRDVTKIPPRYALAKAEARREAMRTVFED